MTRRDASETRQKRLDVPRAEARYVSLNPVERTYAVIAREFGVSETTVRKWARRRGWLAMAQQADDAAARAGVRAAVRSREDRARQTARIRDAAADVVEAALEGRVADPEFARKSWETAEKHYRLDLGEATDRVSLTEVRDLAERFQALAAKWVAADVSVEERKAGYLADLVGLELVAVGEPELVAA